jgi:hypothetical protein
MLAETSSAPGGSTLDVGPTAAEFAELMLEPIFAKSDAAAARYASVAFTYDICTLRAGNGGQKIVRPPTADWTNQIVGPQPGFLRLLASFAWAERTRPGLPTTAIRAAAKRPT